MMDKKSNMRQKEKQKGRSLHKNVATTLTVFGLIVAAIITVFIGSTPHKYDLQIGDISVYDISAPRDIADKSETMRRALVARSQVPNVMIRSEEKSDASIDEIRVLLSLASDCRNDLYGFETVSPDPESTSTEETETGTFTIARAPDNHEIELAISTLISDLSQKEGIILPSGDADLLIRMSEERFRALNNTIMTEARVILSETLDEAALQRAIASSVEHMQSIATFFKDDALLAGRLLNLTLRPNVEFNEEATEKARIAAYDRVMNDPVMVSRGTRILSQGDVITPEIMSMLNDLNMTKSASFDWARLGGIAGLTLLCTIIAVLFFRRYVSILGDQPSRSVIALSLTTLLPLLMSAYLARNFPLAPPVYFTAVVVTAYFGFRAAIFTTSLLIILIMPMASFHPSFPIVGIIGCMVASLFTQGSRRQDNYAHIIVGASLATASAALLMGILQKESASLLVSNILQATLSGGLSVIAAIGIMPLFELIFNTVSPLRLIELSQPGHPLMKRLFVEAPGTSQHSMMVANLADTAAEAIGANAMIARVGAYFHDVGKLENPMMFTENQTGANPHDQLTPLESARIITRHPENSYTLGRKYRLPLPLLKIANEHHGSTVLQYFWRKACREAEMKGFPPPSIDAFRYRTPLPSSRESAIVMLADSTEAAMRSEGINKLDAAEKLIRNVVKVKIDQDQLKNSGLSFADIEKIIHSFLQIYAGHFHERIAYSEQNKTSVPDPERDSSGMKDTFVKETTMPMHVVISENDEQTAPERKDITAPVRVVTSVDNFQETTEITDRGIPVREFDQDDNIEKVAERKYITAPVRVVIPRDGIQAGTEQIDRTMPSRTVNADDNVLEEAERKEKTMTVRAITPGDGTQSLVGLKDRMTPIRIVTERRKKKNDKDD